MLGTEGCSSNGGGVCDGWSLRTVHVRTLVEGQSVRQLRQSCTELSHVICSLIDGSLVKLLPRARRPTATPKQGTKHALLLIICRHAVDLGCVLDPAASIRL